MLSRDFTKSNKDYLNKNKYVLSIIAAFLVIGLIIACIFGFNGNFEFKGYNEFSVTVGSVSGKKANEYRQEIKDIVNSKGADFDSISVFGEGDLTKFVVRYSDDISAAKQSAINTKIAAELKLEITKISEHNEVDAVVEAKDYVYTASAILLVIVAATIFTYFRHNGASAIAILLACVLGTFGFMSVSAILRLSIGLSYFAMLVVLNLLIAYCALNIFESVKESNFLANDNYSNAISYAMKKSRFRLCVLSIAIMLIGVLFVLLAPTPIRLVSLNIMFMAVIVLAVSCYVVPFVWSMFITRSNSRKVKIKVKK